MQELCHGGDALREAARTGHREAVGWILEVVNDENKIIQVIEQVVRDGEHDVL
ncbi:hypothetical protein PI124_g20289 [Phytophthora idaei]|nr:hypothetical protein PI125_g26339 [Phytophthora idaei]KAG3122566.1 hypothetical protein PI126_g24093 [Phytophthora idaei]KAG3234655.1 hypothetical protein PI124_g20289 [Phytophthora idaei]